MPKASDPFYERKPVPNEFIEHVGPTGLSPAEETVNRERKFSLKSGGDLRRFSNPKAGGKVDPFYQRKPVPDSFIHGVAPTGLTKEEEYLNRERKYSVNGVDVRKFSDSTKSGWHPSDDPYYGRKAVKKPQIEGVGETNMTRAEEFEVRENKAALFDLSSDPFQQITGSGHRASVSGAAGPVAAAAARRRSSAVAPDHYHSQEHHNHSGYEGNTLQPIQSRVEGDEIRPSTEAANGSSRAYPTTAFTSTTGPTTTTTTTTTTAAGLNPATSTSINPVTSSLNPAADVKVRDDTGHQVGTTGHTAFYDQATRDLDNVGPHDRA